jgi:hypothetical protein
MLITTHDGSTIRVSDEVYRAVDNLKVEIDALKTRLAEYEGPEALGKRGMNSTVVRRLTAALYQCIGLAQLKLALLDEGAEFDWVLAGLWAIDTAEASDLDGSGVLMDALAHHLESLEEQVDIRFDQYKALAFALRYYETHLAEEEKVASDKNTIPSY